jgi:hypothetical protein
MASTSDNKFAIRIILIVLCAGILIVLVTQYQQKSTLASPNEVKQVKPIVGKELFEQYEPSSGNNLPVITQPIKAAKQPASGVENKLKGNGVRPHEPLNMEDYRAVDFETESKLPADCLPRDRLSKDDLLPKDAANSKWAQVNPAGQGDVQDQNFLTAGFHVGINTIGQSLRNANYQLRSDIPNPRVQVSPWNQTTIEYDSSRRAFEIGECE